MLKHAVNNNEPIISFPVPSSFPPEIKRYAEERQISFAEAAKILLGNGMNQAAIERSCNCKEDGHG